MRVGAAWYWHWGHIGFVPGTGEKRAAHCGHFNRVMQVPAETLLPFQGIGEAAAEVCSKAFDGDDEPEEGREGHGEGAQHDARNGHAAAGIS